MKQIYEALNHLGLNFSLLIGGIIGSLIGMKPNLPWWKQIISVLVGAFIANYTAPIIVSLFGMGAETLPGIGFVAGYSGKAMLDYVLVKLKKK